MPSPFPGMDPYLVSRWSNVHVMMMGIIATVLKRVLPPGLEARPEEEVRIESLAGERMQGFKPDIAVDYGRRDATTTVSGTSSAVAESQSLWSFTAGRSSCGTSRSLTRATATAS